MISVKKVESGKILYENFSNSVDLIADGWQMHPSVDRFYMDLTEGTLNLLHGPSTTYLLRELPEKAVMEMWNTYNPVTEKDFGGFVAYQTECVKLELLEYYNSDLGATLAFPFVRLVKDGNQYDGYGSQDTHNWDVRGAIEFECSNLWGIELEGETGETMKIHTLSIYKDTKIRFRALPANSRIEIYETGMPVPTKIGEIANTGYEEEFSVFNYVMPLSLDIKIYNDQDELIAEGEHEEVFGGDVFHCGNFLEVYYNGAPLDVHCNDFGYINGFYKDFKLEIRNMINAPHDDVNIEIKKYFNEFGWEWVEICEDVNGVPSGNFGKTLQINQVPALDSVFFWARITRSSIPVEVDDYLFDFVINVW